MQLFTKEQQARLMKNGQTPGADHRPVVKLFTPDAACTWLLTEIDPDQPGIAFGLCDLGLGYPELGPVSLEELKRLREKLNLPVERDRHFEARYSLSVYARAADARQAITEDAEALARAAA